MALTRVAHYHDHGYALMERWVRCRESKCTDPTDMWDKWVCTKRIKVRNEDRYNKCGEVYWFRRLDPKVVGGPRTRALDRRYAFGYHYRCKHPVGIVRHESAPDPDQPVQDPQLLEQIEHLKVVAKEARKKRGRKPKTSTA